MFRNRPGIRFKLVFMSSFLLVIPWLGYRYILEMEEYLSRGQEQIVLGTARALATALSERPELFNAASFSPGGPGGGDLYVYPVFHPLAIDGTLADWRDYQQYEQAYREASRHPYPENRFTSFRTRGKPGDPLSYRLMLGESNRHLYVYFKVDDRHLVWRDPDSPRVDRSDSLRISIITREGLFERYVVAPSPESEFIYPYRIGTDITDVSSLEHEPRITGRWEQNAEGYEVELRLPLEMLGARLGMAIQDVDDTQGRALDAIVATSGINHPEELGHLLRPTPEIDRIVAGMGHTQSRIQVVDSLQRVLLSVGDIQSATGMMVEDAEREGHPVWRWIEDSILHPLYYQVLTKPTTDFVDELYLGGILEGEHIAAALEGLPRTRFRTLPDSGTRILEAAYPIVAGQEVLGGVIVDQNMNGIRTFRNQALEKLFDTMIGILLLTMAALFFFASSLSSRIRALRNQAEKIIDDSGRLANTIVPSRSRDEIGDLSRSFYNMVDRLSQYTHYLENMSSRLSHELRTPVTVVRSSLENLGLVSRDPEAGVYIQRAEEGIKRLNLILTNMSEASRLEQILQSSDKEPTDLAKVVEACMQGYSLVYPKARFRTTIGTEPVIILGVADYIAQLLDKLIANAVEFSHADRPIRVSCQAEGGEAVISVINSGPYLAAAMKDRIFDSMVSVRPEGRQDQPHLGMGLHIARMITEFHGGYIYADNLMEEEGVMVVLRIPLKSS